MSPWLPQTWQEAVGNNIVSTPSKYDFTIYWNYKKGETPDRETYRNIGEYYSNQDGGNNLSSLSHTYKKASATTSDKDNYIVMIDCGENGFFDALYGYNNSAIPFASIRQNLRKVYVDIGVGIESPLRSVTGAFYRIDSLNEIGNKTLYNCNTATDFSHLFDSWRNKMKTIPPTLFKNCYEARNMSYVFEGVNSLKRVPRVIFANCPKLENLAHAFHKCYKIVAVDSALFKANTELKNIQEIFESCWNLREIPKNLFDNNKKLTNCYKAFRMNEADTADTLTADGITHKGLPFPKDKLMTVTTAVPDLWNREKFPNINTSGECYLDCKKAKNFNEIPQSFL